MQKVFHRFSFLFHLKNSFESIRIFVRSLPCQKNLGHFKLALIKMFNYSDYISLMLIFIFSHKLFFYIFSLNYCDSWGDGSFRVRVIHCRDPEIERMLKIWNFD